MAEEALSRVPVLVAPTASGKTHLVLQLLEEFPRLVVISADSRKIYRHLEIGTNKPPREVRHRFRLVDFLEPTEFFDAYTFRQLAEQEIQRARQEGRPVLVVAGTPLYLYALFRGLFRAPRTDPEIRRRLLERWHRGEPLYEELQRVDPETARRVHPADWIRITRALEVYYQTGRPISWWRTHRAETPRYAPLYVGLYRSRPELYRRIEHRVEAMMAAGLLEEVQALRRRYPADSPAFRTIGYRELLRYLEGEGTLDQAVQAIKRNTKVYLRRQTYFFRKLGDIPWLPPEQALQALREVLGRGAGEGKD